MQAIKPAFCHMVNPCSNANQAIIPTPDEVVATVSECMANANRAW
jgi:hypothetical protein